MEKEVKIDRAPTGIPGFDELVQGGFPRDSIILVSGTPGTSKTIFGMQFIANGALKYGEKGIYITLEQSKESLILQFKEFGYDLEKLEKEEKIWILDANPDENKEDPFSKLTNYEFDLKIRDFKPKRIVMDSLSLILNLSATYDGYRRNVGKLSKIFRDMGATVLFTHERTKGGVEEIDYSIEEFVSDGIVFLQMVRKGNILERMLIILKMRETKHSTGIYPFMIGKEGIEISPLQKL